MVKTTSSSQGKHGHLKSQQSLSRTRRELSQQKWKTSWEDLTNFPSVLYSFSPGCNTDQRYNGETNIPTYFFHRNDDLHHLRLSSLPGEWKPGSFVAVTTFAILALALFIGTAYDIFNRVVFIKMIILIIINTCIKMYNWYKRIILSQRTQGRWKCNQISCSLLSPSFKTLSSLSLPKRCDLIFGNIPIFLFIFPFFPSHFPFGTESWILFFNLTLFCVPDDFGQRSTWNRFVAINRCDLSKCWKRFFLSPPKGFFQEI